MLEVITKGFAAARETLTGQTTLTAENIDPAVRAIRVALLEADVELGVVKRFLTRVRERAIGTVVQTRKGGAQKRSAGDHFTYICHRELIALMGSPEGSPLAFYHPVTVIMLVGLQGVGKTTTSAKLASTLINQGRKPLLVAADTQRFAAQEQLGMLGKRLDVPVFSEQGLSPTELCARAKQEAKAQRRDVIILDTAGRLTIDAPLMQELRDIKSLVSPHEILLVCDAMAGQDTVQTAKTFDAQLGLTGFIMTKLDGDARGGAALSLRAICQKPIKFLGTGEDLGTLERFRPEGLASRILGMGDVVGLMEDFEQVIDEKQAEADSKKLLRGQFGLDDFLGQMRLIKKMGPLKNVLAKMPGFGAQGAQVDDSQLTGIEALIQSMTPHERKAPAIIDASRQRRIARGAGRPEKDLVGLIERFSAMQKMMAGFAKQPGLMGGLPKMGSMGNMGQLKKMLGQAQRGSPPPGSLANLPGLGGAALPSSGEGGASSMVGFPRSGGAQPQASTPSPEGLSGLSPEQQAALERMQAAMGQGPRQTHSQRDRDRAKSRRKAERKARKKARR